jgi:hypothetical protein
VAPRPYWKGYLKLSLVSCSIAHRPKRWRRRQTSSPEAACREKDGSVQGAGFDTWNTLRATAR